MLKRKRLLVLCAALLGLSPLALAKTTPVLDLFGDSRWIDAGNTEEFVFEYRVPNGKALEVTLDFFMAPFSMNLSRIDLRFEREVFTPADQQMVNTLVWRVAAQCLNISETRKAAVTSWLAQQNNRASAKTLANFGPMAVRFERFIDVRGHYLTVVGLGRSGTPGVSPWVNHCEYTGGAG